MDADHVSTAGSPPPAALADVEVAPTPAAASHPPSSTLTRIVLPPPEPRQPSPIRSTSPGKHQLKTGDTFPSRQAFKVKVDHIAEREGWTARVAYSRSAAYAKAHNVTECVEYGCQVAPQRNRCGYRLAAEKRKDGEWRVYIKGQHPCSFVKAKSQPGEVKSGSAAIPKRRPGRPSKAGIAAREAQERQREDVEAEQDEDDAEQAAEGSDAPSSSTGEAEDAPTEEAATTGFPRVTLGQPEKASKPDGLGPIKLGKPEAKQTYSGRGRRRLASASRRSMDEVSTPQDEPSPRKKRKRASEPVPRASKRVVESPPKSVAPTPSLEVAAVEPADSESESHTSEHPAAASSADLPAPIATTSRAQEPAEPRSKGKGRGRWPTDRPGKKTLKAPAAAKADASSGVEDFFDSINPGLSSTPGAELLIASGFTVARLQGFGKEDWIQFAEGVLEGHDEVNAFDRYCLTKLLANKNLS